MKYALVTGASRGIGRAVALRLAAEGYSILVNYVSNAAAAEEVKALIEAAGGSAELMRFNVANEAEVSEAIGAWQEAHKGEYISVLVNNAGIRRDNVLAMMPAEDWDAVVNPTVRGFFNVTHLIVPAMMRKRWGRIVNISSLSGQKGLPGQANYSAAKAAVIGATKALAQEVAVRGVTVNAVAPGFIETDMTKGLDTAELTAAIPMKRFGKPEDIAEAVAFLASEGAGYITGAVLPVNGGLYT